MIPSKKLVTQDKFYRFALFYTFKSVPEIRWSSTLVFSASGGRANSFEVPVNLVVGDSNVNLGLTDTIGTVSRLLIHLLEYYFTFRLL